MKTLFLSTMLILFCAFGFSQQKNKEYPQTSVIFNPLGFLQFGPMLQMDIKIAKNSYLVPHWRYSYLGLMSHLIWTEFEEDSKYFPASMAGGLGYKSFIATKSSNQFWYIGGVVEFQSEEARYNRYSSDIAWHTRTAIGGYLNGGYRWRFENGFFFNTGLIAGMAFDLKNEEVSYSYTINHSRVRPAGMLEFSLGWEF